MTDIGIFEGKTGARRDILPTADGHGSSSTAAVWCRFPTPHAVGHTQTIGTTRRISWRATSTRRATTTLAQGHRESPVMKLIRTSTKKKKNHLPKRHVLDSQPHNGLPWALAV